MVPAGTTFPPIRPIPSHSRVAEGSQELNHELNIEGNDQNPFEDGNDSGEEEDNATDDHRDEEIRPRENRRLSFFSHANILLLIDTYRTHRHKLNNPRLPRYIFWDLVNLI